MTDVFVFGNATLDVLCHPVDDVPRHRSISFERSIVAPGGCGSNTAIGLAAQGIPTALIARIGADDAASLVERYWARVGLETGFVRRLGDASTGVSVGLIDSDAQPRFVHAAGANVSLSAADLDVGGLTKAGARHLHVGGYLVLPGVSGEALADRLALTQEVGLTVSLDVALSQGRGTADDLWPCLPYVDYFLCNTREARYLSGVRGTEDRVGTSVEAARMLRRRGAGTVIVKLGAQGCRIEGEDVSQRVPACAVEVVDTTGAGDAFAAGFIAATVRGADPVAACEAGNEAGARIVGALGAVSAWF